MSEFTAKIQAILDTKKIPSQIADIEKEQIKLSNFKLDTKGLPSQIQASLDGHNFTISLDGIKTANLSSQMKTAANRAGGTFTQTLVDRINAQLSNGGIESSIARITAQYEKLGSTGHTKLGMIGSDLKTLNDLHSQMIKNHGNPKALIADYDSYIDTLTRVKNNLVTVSSQQLTRFKPENWTTPCIHGLKRIQGLLSNMETQLKNCAASSTQHLQMER